MEGVEGEGRGMWRENNVGINSGEGGGGYSGRVGEAERVQMAVVIEI